jgi:hypothetical protein
LENQEEDGRNLENKHKKDGFETENRLGIKQKRPERVAGFVELRAL